MKQEALKRINSRIEPSQFKFIKNYAKKNEMTEGEALRSILESFINNN